MANNERDILVSRYFEEGLTYVEILSVLNDDHGIYISLRHLHRILRSLMLRRRHYRDPRSIVDCVTDSIRHSGRLHGYRIMRQRCIANGLRVRTQDVVNILRICDPMDVSERTARRFSRRSYFAPGPNFVWHIDGYDKLKPYGLCIHGCICGFSRKILWLNVYKTNNNPRVIAGYFIETVEKYGGTAKMIRGDFGTENVVVREIQCHFRRNDITTSYIAGASTQNQRIESWWGYLRREHMQYWMDLLKNLQEIQAFSGSELDKNLVLFCFTALIQAELDLAVKMWDNHYIRPSSNTNAQSSKPRVIFEHPGLWNTRDFLCPVSLGEIRTCYVQVEPRSVICCNADIYDTCISIMRENEMIPPMNGDEAVTLYRHLRTTIDAAV